MVPRTRELDGEDPTAFILSANVHRRNLTTGQRAMAVAMLAPEPPEASESGKKGGRGKKGPASGSLSVSSQRIAEAREVLKYSRELAETVMAGPPERRARPGRPQAGVGRANGRRGGPG